MRNITEIENLTAVSPEFDGFIIGLDGVMYDGEAKVNQNAVNVVGNLHDSGKKIVFLSNSSRRANDVSVRLARLGIGREMYDGLLTSGEILYHDLKNRTDGFFFHLGKKYYYIGDESNRFVFETAGYRSVSSFSAADFAVVGDVTDKNDEINNYMEMFQQALAKTLPMLCADADRIKIAAGNIPMMGPGYIAERYSRMGGRVFVRGKPQADVFAYCMEGMGITDKTRVAVVGDGFETDIMGGHNAGLKTIFISGGVHGRELRIIPGEKVNIQRIGQLADNYGVTPDYTMMCVG